MIIHILWILTFLININNSQDTRARDYCWQFDNESSCNNQIIPDSELQVSPNGEIYCLWVDLLYLGGCDYTDPLNPVPIDLNSNITCPTRPNAPDSQCVPDDCSLYSNESQCSNSELCEWVINSRTLFNDGRCMHS